MKVSELKRILDTIKYPDKVEVVVDAIGLKSVIGGKGGVCPKVDSAAVGIDWDSGFVFLYTKPRLCFRKSG